MATLTQDIERAAAKALAVAETTARMVDAANKAMTCARLARKAKTPQDAADAWGRYLYWEHLYHGARQALEAVTNG